MYNLHLTAEQQEFREAVRDFVEREIKPVVLHPDRLQDFSRPLPLALIAQAAQMGLRSLMLSEELGGAGGDALTACLVAEELAAGDVNIAVTLAETWTVAGLLFEKMMTTEQRTRYLAKFLEDDAFHLAMAPHRPDPELGWKYHRPLAEEPAARLAATRQSNGDWIVNGTTAFVQNAPLAKLIVIQARSGSGALVTLLAPAGTAGMTVREVGGPDTVKWYHGAGGEIAFSDCRIPAENLLGDSANAQLKAMHEGRGTPQTQAMNVGVARAAYEAGVNYAKIRVQGARPIIQHQAIGTILADAAVKIEVARNIVRTAAWAADHPDAVADRSLTDLPLQSIARVYASEALHEATEGATECFGAMGVMLDMPLAKYMHDARVFLHSGGANAVEKLHIAEALAGFERPAAAAVRAAA